MSTETITENSQQGKKRPHLPDNFDDLNKVLCREIKRARWPFGYLAGARRRRADRLDLHDVPRYPKRPDPPRPGQPSFLLARSSSRRAYRRLRLHDV